MAPAPSGGPSGWTDLDRACTWMSANEASGDLAVVGNRHRARLFFRDGALTFALLDAEDMAALGVSYIDAESWLAALSAPGAEIDLSETLALVGVPEAQISAFACDAIDRVVAALRQNASMKIERSDRPSPLGDLVRFDVSQWFDTTQASSVSFGVYRLTRIA